MLDLSPQLSPSIHIAAGFCSQQGEHAYLHVGEIHLLLSHQEFLQLFQVVRDVARKLQENMLAGEQQAVERDCQAWASLPFFRPEDAAVRLVTVLSLLQGETNPARAKTLQSLAAELDEEVRQDVRRWARERATLAHAKET